MRTLLVMTALLGGMANAATKLYSVTVKTSPPFLHNVFQLYAGSTAVLGAPLASAMGKTASFKLSAGIYTVTSTQPDDVVQQYEEGRVQFTVRSDKTVTVPIDPYPVMDQAGKAAFTRLLSGIKGRQVACEPGAVNDLCASVMSPVQTVARRIDTVTDAKRVEFWQGAKADEGHWTGAVKVGANSYVLYVLPLDVIRSFLVFERE
ncbi:hypothetical protein MF271_22625 (plasmid) [Deinococcus sp. KNUC1210]|uniref:hypothetical protein n=1 Tax=Deinococcus sp. KNUC1210 TaxID=2917691 RepID=UPI001EF10153|nr:hypothetical protein [Deinococcus sp. KNUC1210]ULH18263.1 hypothetical protein MF271_22625 [Deinococcus sp. KNUC1210]